MNYNAYGRMYKDNERTSVFAGEPRLVTATCLSVPIARTEA